MPDDEGAASRRRGARPRARGDLARREVADAADDAFEGLGEALRGLRERPGSPHRVEELAHRAGLSPDRFSRRVRALFGLSPSQLVIKVRVDAARRMLREGEDPIARIALACGYCDQSAFTRQFKAVTGLTPAQYRGLS